VGGLAEAGAVTGDDEAARAADTLPGTSDAEGRGVAATDAGEVPQATVPSEPVDAAEAPVVGDEQTPSSQKPDELVTARPGAAGMEEPTLTAPPGAEDVAGQVPTPSTEDATEELAAGGEQVLPSLEPGEPAVAQPESEEAERLSAADMPGADDVAGQEPVPAPDQAAGELAAGGEQVLSSLEPGEVVTGLPEAVEAEQPSLTGMPGADDVAGQEPAPSAEGVADATGEAVDAPPPDLADEVAVLDNGRAAVEPVPPSEAPADSSEQQAEAPLIPEAESAPRGPEPGELAAAEPDSGKPEESAMTQPLEEAPADQAASGQIDEPVTLEMPTSGEAVATESGGEFTVAHSSEIVPTVAIGDADAESAVADVRAEAAPDRPEVRIVSIQAAEVEADTLYVAGEAPPGTLVRIFASDELVGEARASGEGRWLLEARADIPLGEIVIRAEAFVEAMDYPAAEAEAPFVRFADGIVLEPIAGSITEDGVPSAATGSLPPPTYVIIRRGDNLWRIARRNYGRGIKYHAIFDANRDRISNPHWIYPGQVFVIPTRDRSWETATR
jgi:hypothetical protein